MAGHVSRVHSIGDPLKDLWNNHIGFQDQFCQAMNVKYLRSGIKNWRHLSERFNIPPSDYESFSGPENISPSEKMLEYLEAVKPDLKVSQFKEACKSADVIAISSFLASGINGGKITESDHIEELWDKDHHFIDDLLLMLDRNDQWKRVAQNLKIPKKDYEKFQNDPESNNGRHLLALLTITESKPLTLEDLKTKLGVIKRNNIIKLLDEKNISGDTLLRDMRSTLYLTEEELNKEDYAYQLALEYKNDGCLNHFDIEMLRPSNSSCNPTERLIEYVIQRHPEVRDPTINHLIIHLMEINRYQELKFFEEYLLQGKDDIKTIKEAFQNNLREAIPRQQREPSTQSETDEADNDLPGGRDDIDRITEQFQNNLDVAPRQPMTQNVARVAPTHQQRQPSPENEDVISGNDDYTDLC